MSLSPGSRLGHYDVIALIGEGESPSLPVTARPRTHPTRLRVTALLVLGIFAAVNIVTTVFSLGGYCLTTYGGNPFAGSVP